MKKLLYTVWEIAEVLLIAVIAVAAIKYFLVQPFIVNGASMEPNFFDGDYLLIDELTYRFKEPQRGDVVVFHAPQDESIYYIKRIIGLPGEKVEVNDNAITIVNSEHPKGFQLDESYLSQGISSSWSGNISITLKPGQYFVLGDNRLNSLDSRYWGPLDQKEIVGHVKLRLWPVTHMSLFNTVKYAY
jgi:signal peptidase I